MRTSRLIKRLRGFERSSGVQKAGRNCRTTIYCRYCIARVKFYCIDGRSLIYFPPFVTLKLLINSISLIGVVRNRLPIGPNWRQVSAKRQHFTPSRHYERLNVKDTRPVNIDLTTIRFPLTAILSITHRITGVIIFIGVAILLYLLGLSLESEAGFAEAQQLLSSPLAKFVVWGIVSGLLYHLVAGTKHLVMDWGFGETLAGAAIGSRITLVLSTLLIVIAGVWIW
jgi:succinate dehydrogenase / fumarate reductase cytochrome b subunit